MLPSSLFSVAPRHLEYASSCVFSETSETETSPSSSPPQKPECQMHTPLLSLGGRGHQTISAFVCCAMGLLEQQHVTQLFFVHGGPAASGVCWAHPHSEIGKIKGSPSGSPLKIQNGGDMFQSPLPPLKERLLSYITSVYCTVVPLEL